jgi:hypothetical protein
MSDVVTPNYQELISSGVIVNNPCLYESTLIDLDGGGYFKAKKGSYWYEQYPYVTAARFGTTAWPFSKDHASLNWARPDIAKLRALSDMDSTPYAFGEDAFEIRETIKFIRDPLQSLKKLALSFRRRKIKTLRQLNRTMPKRLSRRKRRLREAQAVAGVFNSYSFAARPLLRSILDAAEAVNKTLQGKYKYKQPPERRTARGYDLVEDDIHDVFTVGPANNRAYADRTCTSWDQIKASILYEVDNPHNDFQYITGLRAKDFPYIVWQVLPLSFMVDRLVDVSSMIAALTNLNDPSVHVLSACVRRKSLVTTTLRYTSHTATGWTFSPLIGDEVHVAYFCYDRQVWFPSTWDAVPSLTPKRLVGTLTDIAELLSVTISLLR